MRAKRDNMPISEPLHIPFTRFGSPSGYARNAAHDLRSELLGDGRRCDRKLKVPQRNDEVGIFVAARVSE